MPVAFSLFNFQRYNRETQQALLALGLDSLKPIFSMVVAGVLVFSLEHHTVNVWLQIWLLWALITTLAGLWYQRYWTSRLKKEKVLSEKTLRHAELWGCAYGVVVALLWGSCSQFMQPDYVSNLLIAMIYFGVCAGAASLSVLGMAHMGIAALIAFPLFAMPISRVFPSYWMPFTLMVAFYHLVILISSWQRHQIVAKNIMLTQKQEKLIEAKQSETNRANKANQEKSIFLAAASHDLRQPVHAIMLLGHALKMRLNDDRNKYLVEQILIAGKVLSDQFNSLMELVRLEGGGYQLVNQTLPVAGFLRRKLWVYQEIAQNKGVVLRGKLDWRLHSAGLRSDHVLLNRIMDNLLDNAIKFTPKGRKILLCIRLRKGCVQMSVIDQGKGIPEQEMDNVFMPHVQLNNPERERSQGIGLGLSIVKEAVQLLQADLTLTSVVSRGSCFQLTLKDSVLEAVFVPIMDIPRYETDIAYQKTKLKGSQLLLVEDDPMVASALMSWAESWGIHVLHYTHPDEVSLQINVDMIICDIRLPSEQDGVYWLSYWLVEWPNAGGVLISGELTEAVQDQVEQEGLLLLEKPVDPDVLLKTLLSLRHSA